MLTYDEPEIVARLARLSRTQKAAFAAACAERLVPLFLRYAASKESVDGDVIRSVVDGVWRAIGGASADLEPLQALAEDLVPEEDEEWSAEAGYAQNAAASAAYSVRAWLTDDPEEAGWAARQVYEAADYAAQQAIDTSGLESATREQALLAHEVVQVALAGILDDLAFVEGQGDFATLAQHAAAVGGAWAETIR